MNYRKFSLILILSVLLGLLPFGGSAFAKPLPPADLESPLLSWQYVLTHQGLGKTWVDEAGMLQVRGRVDQGTITGDLLGKAVVVYNASIQPKTGDGEAWGTITMDTGESGAWEGSWVYVIEDFMVVGGKYYATSVSSGIGNTGKTLVATSIFEARPLPSNTPYQPKVIVYQGYIKPAPATFQK